MTPAILMTQDQSASHPTSSSSLQGRMIALFIMITVFSALIQVAFLARSFATNPDLPEHVQVAAEAAVPSIMAGNLIWIACFLVPLMLLVGFNATRKVARPVAAINRHLGELSRTGSGGKPCLANPSDELGPLIGALNAAMARLENDRLSAQAEAH